MDMTNMGTEQPIGEGKGFSTWGPRPRTSTPAYPQSSAACTICSSVHVGHESVLNASRMVDLSTVVSLVATSAPARAPGAAADRRTGVGSYCPPGSTNGWSGDGVARHPLGRSHLRPQMAPTASKQVPAARYGIITRCGGCVKLLSSVFEHSSFPME